MVRYKNEKHPFRELFCRFLGHKLSYIWLFSRQFGPIHPKINALIRLFIDRFVNTSCVGIIFLLMEILVLASKNTSIWASSTIHPLVFMVWISMLYLVVLAWTFVIGDAKPVPLDFLTALWRKMPWNGFRLNMMESFLIQRNPNSRKLCSCPWCKKHWNKSSIIRDLFTQFITVLTTLDFVNVLFSACNNFILFVLIKSEYSLSLHLFIVFIGIVVFVIFSVSLLAWQSYPKMISTRTNESPSDRSDHSPSELWDDKISPIRWPCQFGYSSGRHVDLENKWRLI